MQGNAFLCSKFRIDVKNQHIQKIFLFMQSAFSLSYFGILSPYALAGENWWQFRGPRGRANSVTGLPLKWSETENVIGNRPSTTRLSSPVIWGNQVWLTTATADGRKLFAISVDKDTGRLIHDLHLFDVANPCGSRRTTPTRRPRGDRRRPRGPALWHLRHGLSRHRQRRGVVEARDLNCDHEAGAGLTSSPTLIGNKFVVHVTAETCSTSSRWISPREHGLENARCSIMTRSLFTTARRTACRRWCRGARAATDQPGWPRPVRLRSGDGRGCGT